MDVALMGGHYEVVDYLNSQLSSTQVQALVPQSSSSLSQQQSQQQSYLQPQLQPQLYQQHQDAAAAATARVGIESGTFLAATTAQAAPLIVQIAPQGEKEAGGAREGGPITPAGARSPVFPSHTPDTTPSPGTSASPAPLPSAHLLQEAFASLSLADKCALSMSLALSGRAQTQGPGQGLGSGSYQAQGPGPADDHDNDYDGNFSLISGNSNHTHSSYCSSNSNSR